MLGSAGSPSAGGAPGRQPPGTGLGARCPEGLRQGPASHYWWSLSCFWMEGLQSPPRRLGQRSKTERSRGTHGVGRRSSREVEGARKRRASGLGGWTVGGGSGAWGGDKVGVRRSCPPQARLGNPINHRRPSPSAGADRRVEAGFVISLPLVPSSLHFPPRMGLDTLPAPPSSNLSQNFRM